MKAPQPYIKSCGAFVMPGAAHIQGMERSRVLAGVPTGGRFAKHTRSRDTVQLPVSPVPDAKATTVLTDREAIDVSLMHVKNFARNSPGFNRQDFEDMAQEALMSVHVSIMNSRAESFTPGLITSAARHMHARGINLKRGIRHEDARADAELRSIIAKDEQTLGRHLTTAEIDFMAGKIRDEWENPRHKPSEDFHKRTRLVDYTGDASNEVLKIEATDYEFRREHGTAGDLAGEIEDKTIDKATAKIRFWNAISDYWDVPKTQPSLTVANIATAKKVVDFHGGILDVAERYLETETLSPQVAAMFAPFGTITKPERKRVASVLLARPALAARIWDSALASAYKRPKPRGPAWVEDE